jgi:hypothetical protein
MNQRIQELAEQAGEYVNEVYTPPVRSKTPGKIWEDGHVDWHIQFNQKFAELIVRECASQCLSDDCMRILNHFGVEFGVEDSKGWICPKCGIDRIKDSCPQGHTAAIEGNCPMIGVA